jgi:hypothetical protein
VLAAAALAGLTYFSSWATPLLVVLWAAFIPIAAALNVPPLRRSLVETGRSKPSRARAASERAFSGWPTAHTRARPLCWSRHTATAQPEVR